MKTWKGIFLWTVSFKCGLLLTFWQEEEEEEEEEEEQQQQQRGILRRGIGYTHR